eukprot:scpid67636/ scgid7119/ 
MALNDDAYLPFAESATLTPTEMETFAEASIDLCNRVCTNQEFPTSDIKLSCDDQGRPRTVWSHPFFSEQVDFVGMMGPTGQLEGVHQFNGRDALQFIANGFIQAHRVQQQSWVVQPSNAHRPGIRFTYEVYTRNGKRRSWRWDVVLGLREENVIRVKRVIVQSIWPNI